MDSFNKNGISSEMYVSKEVFGGTKCTGQFPDQRSCGEQGGRRNLLPENVTDKVTQRLHDCVRHIKTLPEVRANYMTLEDYHVKEVV